MRTAGSDEPIFSEDGKTIFYRYGNRFYATPILEASTDGKRFRAGRPEVVVEGAYSNVPGDFRTTSAPTAACCSCGPTAEPSARVT